MSEPTTEPQQAPDQGGQAPLTDDHAQALLADAISRGESASGPDDIGRLEAEIARLRRENASARTQAKQNAAEEARAELAQTIGKALGLVQDDEPADPTVLTQRAAESAAEARQAKLELAVWRAAGDSADAAALLDSRAFLTSVAEIDPSDRDGITAAITQAVTANPRLARSQGTPPRMAPNKAQGTSAQPPLGLKERIAAAEKDGDVKTLARLKAALVLENSK